MCIYRSGKFNVINILLHFGEITWLNYINALVVTNLSLVRNLFGTINKVVLEKRNKKFNNSTSVQPTTNERSLEIS